VARQKGKQSLRKAATAGILLCCLGLPGCVKGFPHPLAPVDRAFVDPQLLGSWDCTGTQDPKPGVMTVVDFDGKQYCLLLMEQGKPPTLARGHSSRIGTVPFLSFKSIDAKDDDEGWWFLEYTFPDEQHLRLRLVDPEPFRKVETSPRKVRALLERRLRAPDTFIDLSSCVRRSEGQE